MKVSNLTMILLLAFAAMVSCKEEKKDDNNTPNNNVGCNYVWSERLADEAAALSQAASAYASDPTTANCEAYRQALLDYLNEADNVIDCVPQASLAQYQQAVDAAKASANSLQC